MVAFYKHYIPAWMDGTDELSDGAYRAYHVICQLIYLREGPITLNERGIAGRCKQRVDRFQRHLDELLRAGKLKIIDGKIHNARAQLELDNIRPSAGLKTPLGFRLTEGNLELIGSSSKLSRRSPKLSPDNPLKTLGGDRCEASAASKTRQEEKYPPTPLVGGTDESVGWKSFQRKWGRSDATAQVEQLFAALSEPDRLAAIDGIDGYVAEARRLDRSFVTAKKYLLERRWEGVKPAGPAAASAAPTAPTRVKIWKGSPQGEAWMAYLRSLGRNQAALLELNRLRTAWDFGDPYKAPSEWPPKVKEQC